GQIDVPEDIQGRVVQVAAGKSHSSAMLDDGSVRVWGSNASGQTEVPEHLRAEYIGFGTADHVLVVEKTAERLTKVSGDHQIRRAGRAFNACCVKVTNPDGSAQRGVPVTFQLQGTYASFLLLTQDDQTDTPATDTPPPSVTVPTGPGGTCCSPGIQSYKNAPGTITVYTTTDNDMDATDFTLIARGNAKPYEAA
ncbi:RCC1-like domain-containing protein, partial [Streptomyces lavendulae]|uniref:RCC1-like domain-containing protein n=1 Tax=Streptomyces lavendulae TaxID=1914 RepID=UPI0036F066BB